MSESLAASQQLAMTALAETIREPGPLSQFLLRVASEGENMGTGSAALGAGPREPRQREVPVPILSGGDVDAELLLRVCRRACYLLMLRGQIDPDAALSLVAAAADRFDPALRLRMLDAKIRLECDGSVTFDHQIVPFQPEEFAEYLVQAQRRKIPWRRATDGMLFSTDFAGKLSHAMESLLEGFATGDIEVDAQEVFNRVTRRLDRPEGMPLGQRPASPLTPAETGARWEELRNSLGPLVGKDAAGQAERKDRAAAKEQAHSVRETLHVAKELALLVNSLVSVAAQIKSYGCDHKVPATAAARATELIHRTFASTTVPELDLDVNPRGFEYRSISLDDPRLKARQLLEPCLEWGIGRITFHRDVQAAEVISLLSALFTAPVEDNSSEAFRERLHALGVSNIAIWSIGEEDRPAACSPSPTQDARSAAGPACRPILTPRWLYFALIESVHEIREQAAGHFQIDTRGVQSLARDLCRLAIDRPGAMLPYAMVRRYQEYEYAHPVNTCIVAVATCQRVVQEAARSKSLHAPPC